MRSIKHITLCNHIINNHILLNHTMSGLTAAAAAKAAAVAAAAPLADQPASGGRSDLPLPRTPRSLCLPHSAPFSGASDKALVWSGGHWALRACPPVPAAKCEREIERA